MLNCHETVRRKLAYDTRRLKDGDLRLCLEKGRGLFHKTAQIKIQDQRSITLAFTLLSLR